MSNARKTLIKKVSHMPHSTVRPGLGIVGGAGNMTNYAGFFAYYTIFVCQVENIWMQQFFFLVFFFFALIGII